MTSDSESFSEQRLSPNQHNKAVQNTPDRRAKQPSTRQTPIEREEETRAKETQTRRIKKVKRVKKASEYDITLETRSEQMAREANSNRNDVSPMKPRALSPARGQTTFANAEKLQKRKQEIRRKPNITGGDYVINSLRQSHPSDYDISTQSEFEISDKDLLNDISFSNE